MLVVLISGNQGSGKTTLAKNLIAPLCINKVLAQVSKFADPLYQLHDVIYETLAHWGIPKPAQKDGDLLQLIGTDWGRKKFGPNVWANICKRRVDYMSDVLAKTDAEFSEITKGMKRVMIIDDLRFPEELEAFPDAIKIRLECSEAVRRSRAEYWRENTKHPSETGLNNCLDKFNLVMHTDDISVYDMVQKAAELIIRRAHAG